MLNKVLKSIAAVLISLAVLVSGMPAAAASEISEPAAPMQTEPAVTEPVAAEPILTDPVVTEPAVTEPAITEPVPEETAVPTDNNADNIADDNGGLLSDPAASDPLTADPSVTDPSATDPLVTDPAAADPALTGEEADLPLIDDAARPVFAVQWDTLPMYMGSNGVFRWSIVYENGGYYIYAVTNMYESAAFSIMYEEDGEDFLRYEANTQPVILDSLWNPIFGAYVQSYVENNTRFSEIYIPQSFFKDVVFTIACGQAVSSLDITDSFGMPAMPDVLDEVTTLEEPVGMNDAELADMVSAMALYPGSGDVSNWGIAYENGNYVFYLIGNIYYYQAQMNIGYTPIILLSDSDNVQLGWGNTIASNCKQSVKSDNRNYVKYTIPESALPADFTINYANITVSSADIKASSGAVDPDIPDIPDEPEDPTAAAVKDKLGGSSWALEPGSDGMYHLYLADVSGEAPVVTVTDKTSNEISDPVLYQVASAEEDGLWYSEYTLSGLPQWFDISCNGETKTFGADPNQDIIDKISEKVGSDSWKVEKGEDGRYHIYIVDGAYDYVNITVTDKRDGSVISFDFTAAEQVTDENGNRYSEYIASIYSEWFDIEYNGSQPVTFGRNPNAAYTGIVIDGGFADWDAVPKYAIEDCNPSFNAVEEVAMVWDGDMIYIYLYSSDFDFGAVTGAGPNSNGQYVITTDLGRTLLIQPTRNLTVNGIDDAKVAINTTNWGVPHYWEIAIPASNLPEYLETISFGIYMGDKDGSTPIRGVANLQGGNTPDKVFEGIVYDGLYQDWEYYPHTPITHTGSGTSAPVTDGELGLWSNDGLVYGHVTTVRDVHIQAGGTEFTEAVTIRFNGDETKNFYPCFAAVAEDGTINWNPQRGNLPNGTYEFYMFDQGGWKTAQNIKDFNDPNFVSGGQKVYGKMKVTISEGKNECEYYLEIDKMAELLNMDPSDVKTISANFLRIGPEWVATAGTSTGTFLGIFICLATVSGAYFFKKKKAMGIK